MCKGCKAFLGCTLAKGLVFSQVFAQNGKLGFQNLVVVPLSKGKSILPKEKAKQRLRNPSIVVACNKSIISQRSESRLKVWSNTKESSSYTKAIEVFKLILSWLQVMLTRPKSRLIKKLSHQLLFEMIEILIVSRSSVKFTGLFCVENFNSC